MIQRTRNARARTRFSGLRFGTSYESGIKIKETQLLLLTFQKVEIAKHA